MIKRIIGLLALVASLTVMVFVAIHRNDYQSLLPIGAKTSETIEPVGLPEAPVTSDSLEIAVPESVSESAGETIVEAEEPAITREINNKQ